MRQVEQGRMSCSPDLKPCQLQAKLRVQLHYLAQMTLHRPLQLGQTVQVAGLLSKLALAQHQLPWHAPACGQQPLLQALLSRQAPAPRPLVLPVWLLWVRLAAQLLTHSAPGRSAAPQQQQCLRQSRTHLPHLLLPLPHLESPPSPHYHHHRHQPATRTTQMISRIPAGD